MLHRHLVSVTTRPSVTAAFALLALLSASCTGDDSPGAPTPAVAPTPPAPGTVRTDPAEIPCGATNPRFAARGTVSILGGSSPDAGVLSGLDWVTTDDCERIVLRFLTNEGAPASQIGLTRLEFSPEQGIVRIVMPRDVTVSGIADVLIEASLVERAFVVRSRNGDLAVDLHTGGIRPVEARALLLGSPARLVVDLRPAPDDPEFGSARPSIGDDVVVLSPPPGPADYPLRIRGYARTPSNVITARVTSAGDVVERRITAADSGDAWGEFALTISEGPEGAISLHVVTDRSAVQAGDSGVSISLTMP